MSYGFDLLRLPAGVDRNEAYKKLRQEQQDDFGGVNDTDGPGLIAASNENVMQGLAAELMARHPSLEMFKLNYSQIAKTESITESEARRRFRKVELNDRKRSIQISIFHDEAAAHFSFAGDSQQCTSALQLLWDCLRVLESNGGFSTYDLQIGKVLDLDSDFDEVRNCACGGS